MNKVLLFLLKLSIVGIGIAVVFGAYYYGKQTVYDERSIISPTPAAVSVSPTIYVAPTKETSSTASAIVTAKTQVDGGAILHQLYIIDILPGWDAKRDHKDDSNDVLYIQKGSYRLSIHQSNSGGGVCSFPDAEVEDGPFVNQVAEDDYIELNGFHNERYRRVDTSTEGKGSFEICDKRQDTYQTPTRYGLITYDTPVAPDEITLENLDVMVSSLRNK